VILEEEEVQKAGQLTVLARFYSMRFPNPVALFEDMRRAWRLRAEMSYKSLKDNLFIITFSNEGDYLFVLQGGPWLHRGDAILVAEFDGLTNPSMVLLDTVPIWVRVYDLPLVMMNKARGDLYGSKIGKVREVDVDAFGSNRHDFFRIRVDLPVNRPLKTKLDIKIKINGKEETRRFNVRYERVPHFCFSCGFIGHSDKECAKQVSNEDVPFPFSADLRCSPLKPFERKVSRVKALQNMGVSRKLVFRGAGSASSSSKGHKVESVHAIDLPSRVDAFDAFDHREGKGDERVDDLLASQTNLMHVPDMNSLGQCQQKEGMQLKKVQAGALVKGIASKEPASQTSSEMIPAILF
jgi:cytochrome c